MISRNDVIYAYRLFLGREPESDAVIDRFIDASASISDLRKRFMLSDEFQSNLKTVLRDWRPINAPKPLTWSNMEVEIEVSTKELELMIQHIERNWEKLGVENAHWSVLVQDEYRSEHIEKNEDKFFDSGRDNVEAMRMTALRHGIDIGAFKECFELGCGVGRVTLWLANLFSKVLACDISAPHLSIARETANENCLRNVDFIKLSSVRNLDDLPHFDVLFSVIVLQHNPPPVIALILRTLLMKLRTGGVAFFQIPTYQLGYRFMAKDYLSNLDRTPIMEMHAFPQDALFSLIAGAGCELLEIREDGATGSPNMISNSVFVRKKA
jgi:2-polyprenyl-3-methyl-5-hydroxy-6-metoxy-1,4-benzoquinol methylase